MHDAQYGVFPFKIAGEIFEEILSNAFKKETFSNYPRTDVYHEKGSFYIELAVAKFKEEDITIDVNEHNVLIIRGKIKNKPKEEDRVYLHKAIAARSFERKLDVSFPIEEIKFELSLGILKLELIPRVEKTKVKINKK
jgi:molecular chaperone IbpA